MRLLIATPLYPPDAGGPATYSKLLEKELPKLGTEVKLVKFGDVRHLPVGIRHIAYVGKLLRAAVSADVILALDPVSTGLPALITSSFLRKPLLIKVVGDYAWEQGVQRFGIEDVLDDFVENRHVPIQVAFLRFVQTKVVTFAKVVIVPSHYLKRIVETWGLDSKKIFVIPNAITVSSGGQSTSPGNTEHSVLTVGRLVPWKGILGIIDAVSMLQEDIPDISLTVVGDGPDRNMLERNAKDKGVTVHFMGQQSPAETHLAIGGASVFVLNSTYEGMSHVLLEALALRKPIIATRAGGNTEVLLHNVSGLLIESGDTCALADAIKSVLTDISFANTLAHGAYEASKAYSPESVARSVDSLIRAV